MAIETTSDPAQAQIAAALVAMGVPGDVVVDIVQEPESGNILACRTQIAACLGGRIAIVEISDTQPLAHQQEHIFREIVDELFVKLMGYPPLETIQGFLHYCSNEERVAWDKMMEQGLPPELARKHIEKARPVWTALFLIPDGSDLLSNGVSTVHEGETYELLARAIFVRTEILDHEPPAVIDGWNRRYFNPEARLAIYRSPF